MYEINAPKQSHLLFKISYFKEFSLIKIPLKAGISKSCPLFSL